MITRKSIEYTKLLAICIGPYESFIIDERNVHTDEEIMAFKDKYANEGVIVFAVHIKSPQCDIINFSNKN